MGLYDHTHTPEDALGKLRAATVRVIALWTGTWWHCISKNAQRDYEQAQAEADNWERHYQLALKEGYQNLAHQAQFQRERYEAIASRLKNLVEQQVL